LPARLVSPEQAPNRCTEPFFCAAEQTTSPGERPNPAGESRSPICPAQVHFEPRRKRALTPGAYCGRMTWDSRMGAKRRPDKQVLFVVHYRDGSRSFMRVPPRLAMFGASPPVLKLARERQSTGELPAGDIATLVRAH
jgi:hypothetical protein